MKQDKKRVSFLSGIPSGTRIAYASFALYWPSGPMLLLPFNYHPSYAGQWSQGHTLRSRALGRS